MFRNFQTALPRNTTPATTHTVFIAPTTMPCSLTCSVLAEDSRSSAIFRSSLPTKMHALLRVGDSSVGIKNAEAIQKLAPWKKLIFFQHSDEFFVVCLIWRRCLLKWSIERSCLTHDFIAFGFDWRLQKDSDWLTVWWVPGLLFYGCLNTKRKPPLMLYLSNWLMNCVFHFLNVAKIMSATLVISYRPTGLK